MTMPTPRAVDDAVDRAAREYSAIDTPRGFRERVLERIDAAPGVSWTRLVIPLASAAAVVLVAAVWFIEPPTVPSIGRPASVPQALDGLPIDVARLEPITAPPVPIESALARTTEAAPESAAARAWRERAIPALSRPDALTVDRIQPEPVDLPLLVVAPLATTRLALEPLIPGRPVGR